MTGDDAWVPETLITDRLRLQAVGSGELPFVLRLWTDVAVRRYLTDARPGRSVGTRSRQAVGTHATFIITTATGSQPLGLVGLGPYTPTGETEVSYQLLPEHWGNGYAREAVSAVLDWAFDHLPADEVPRIIAVTQEANTHSRKLLDAVGMHQVDSFTECEAAQTVYALDRDGPARVRRPGSPIRPVRPSPIVRRGHARRAGR